MFHPEVFTFPFLLHLRDRANLSFTSQIVASKEPCNKRALCTLRSPGYQEAELIPSRVCSVSEAARHSFTTITLKPSLRNVTRFLFMEYHIKETDNTLEALMVQGKLETW